MANETNGQASLLKPPQTPKQLAAAPDLSFEDLMTDLRFRQRAFEVIDAALQDMDPAAKARFAAAIAELRRERERRGPAGSPTDYR
jgi:hypothetical protein